MKITSELEYRRQQKLIEIHEKIKKLKLVKNDIKDISKLFIKTNCKIIKTSLDSNGIVFAVKLTGFSGVLGIELFENRRFGTEVSDYAKRAGGVKGMMHSDENLIEKYNLSESEIKEIKKELGVKEKDAFIIIADQESKARKAIISAINRINLQIDSPGLKEVRKANIDGSTSFMRPMPGSARMYPETDLPLMYLSREFINEVKKDLPKLKTEINEELKSKGLNPEMINLVLDSGMIKEYESLLLAYNNPNFIAKLMLVLPKEVASHEKVNSELFTLDILESILKNISEKNIQESDAKHVLENIAKGKTLEESLKIEKTDLSEVETEVAKIIKEKPGLSDGAYMGLVMAKFKGKVSGKEAMEIIKKLVK